MRTLILSTLTLLPICSVSCTKSAKVQSTAIAEDQAAQEDEVESTELDTDEESSSGDETPDDDETPNGNVPGSGTETAGSPLTPGALQIDRGNLANQLSWVAPAPTSTHIGFLLIRRTGSAVSWSPVNGTSYQQDATVGVDHVIVYKGSNHNFSDSPLVGAQTYHYALVSYDQAQIYSSAVVSSIHTIKEIYRSVEVGKTAALASGSGNALTISGLQAEFANDLPTNIGVGDVIAYDSNNSGSINALAIISARLDARHYSVLNPVAAAPTATSVSDEDWHIHRAYTSLANAEAGVENTGIEDTLEDFDDFVIASPDLVALDAIWNIAVYGNATADDTPVTIAGWTTSETHFLRIYSPIASHDVGVSQRHSGKWDATKYRLEANMPAAPYQYRGLLEVQVPHARLEGIQVGISAYTDNHQYAVYLNYVGSEQEMHFSHNIVRGTDAGIHQYVYLVYFAHAGNSSGRFAMWNNLLYDAYTANFTGYCFSHYSNGIESLVFNNTVINCNGGFDVPLGDVLVINNIADARDVGFGNAGNFVAGSDYNLSTLPAIQGAAPGANSVSEIALVYLDKAGDDFHLDATDTVAIGAGQNLSQHPQLPFTRDIDGDIRGPNWDIGADQN